MCWNGQCYIAITWSFPLVGLFIPLSVFLQDPGNLLFWSFNGDPWQPCGSGDSGHLGSAHRYRDDQSLRFTLSLISPVSRAVERRRVKTDNRLERGTSLNITHTHTHTEWLSPCGSSSMLFRPSVLMSFPVRPSTNTRVGIACTWNFFVSFAWRDKHSIVQNCEHWICESENSHQSWQNSTTQFEKDFWTDLSAADLFTGRARLIRSST